MHGSAVTPSFVNPAALRSTQNKATPPVMATANRPTLAFISPQHTSRGNFGLHPSKDSSSLRQANRSARLPTIMQPHSSTKSSTTLPALDAAHNDPEVSTNQGITEPPNLVRTERGDLILKPLANKGEQQSIVLMPGAETTPEQYLALAQELQNASPASLWVGIAKYDMPVDLEVLGKTVPLATVEGYTSPIAISGEADEVVGAMQKAGMKNNKPYIAGHSLGGAFLHQIAKTDANKYAGLIHLSSFLPRRLDADHPAQNMPSITISGELDGLVNILRIAESYYHQVEHAEAEHRDPLARPVVVIEGANHGSFLEGTPPPFVAAHDLTAEAEHSHVQQKVAETIANFIDTQTHPANTESKEKLAEKVSETGQFLKPLIDALKLEGSYHLKYPCSKASKADPEDCWVGSPWVEQVTPFITGANKDGISITTRDEFNPSWTINLPLLTEPGKPPFHHPKVTAPKNPGDPVSIDTVTEAVYDKIDEQFDTGITPNTAQRIRAKFPSRQAVQEAVGNEIKFDPENNENLASKVNQMAIDDGLTRASPKARARFEEHGVPLVAGKDFDVHTGPKWIWSDFEKRLTTDEDGKHQYVIDAAVMRSPTESAIQKIPFLPSKIKKGADELIGGKHFATLLSPAEVMRHIYQEGLRRIPKQQKPSKKSDAQDNTR